MKYRLAPYIQVGLSADALHIGYGSIQTVIQEVKQIESYARLLHFLLTPRTKLEITAYLVEQESYAISEAAGVMELLEQQRLIIAEQELLDGTHPMSRGNLFHGLYSNTPQQQLQSLANKSVVIIGCGGVGASMAIILSSRGIKNLTLIDNDVIEISNLERNIWYQPHDVGQKKLDIIRQRILERYPECEVNLIDDRITSYEQMAVLKQPDFIVLSGDGKHLAHYVNRYAYQNAIPFIIAGYLNDIVIWGPLFVPGQTPCYECFAADYIDKKQGVNQPINQLLNEINSHHVAPSIPELTLASASLAALDVIKYLTAAGTAVSKGKRIGYWSDTMRLQTQVVASNSQCTLCG